MPLLQYSLATVVAAVVSLLCVIAAPADGALTDANIVLADQTYSSFTDISPAAPGNVVTVNNAVFDEVLNFRVRQSTITVRNSVFKKYLSFSDASLDWSQTTIVVENCTIDAQKIDTRYPSIMTAKTRTADGGGSSTWTMVNNRFPGIIWLPKVLSNFALVNISFNQDISSASIAGASSGMISFGSVHNVTKVHVEGNRLDAAGGKTETLVSGGTSASSSSDTTLTIKDNVATRGRLIALLTVCTRCRWDVSGNTHEARGEGLFDYAGPLYLGEFTDSNVSLTSNNITYMTLPKDTRTIAYGVQFYSATVAGVRNFRFTSTGNNFSLSGKEGFVYGFPTGHHPEVVFDIINTTLFHASFGTDIALVGESGRHEHNGLHVTIRGCRGPADEYETSTFRSFQLIDRSTSKMFLNSTITIEDNVIDTASATVGTIGQIGPASTLTVRRNKFSELASLGSATINPGAFAIVEQNEVGASDVGSVAVKNSDYIKFQERVNPEDGVVSIREHCNKVKGLYARFNNPLKNIHSSICNGAGKCDLDYNSSVCPGDPTPLESGDAAITISGATLPEYQAVIVQDNQVLKLAGGTVATRLMIVPHSPGSTACLTNVTIEVKSAAVLRALYVDGGLCGGRFIARHALFNDTDETTWGFLGIRDGWDNMQEMSIEYSDLKAYAPYHNDQVIGIAPALDFSNISANAVLKVLHSSVTGLPLTFPKLSDETTATVEVLNVSIAASKSCVSFPSDLAASIDGVTGECRIFFAGARTVGTKPRVIKRSSITATSNPSELFKLYGAVGDVPLVVEDTVFTMAAPAVPSSSAKSGVSANSGAKFTRCTFNFERGYSVKFIVSGKSMTILDSVFNVAELRSEYVISPDSFQARTFVFENVTVNALDVAASSSVRTPSFAVVRSFDKGLTMTMRNVAFNFAFSSTVFPQGLVQDTSHFPPTVLQVPVSDVFPVLLRGSDGLKGTFLFENVVFGNISSIAQEVTHLSSVNMSFTNVSFSDPQQIRNFQPTGERLNTSNLVFGVADEAVLNRAFPPHPPLIDVTNLLRLNFTGCTTMGGEPLRAERIRVSLSNLTAVPGALVIDDQCVRTKTETKSRTVSAGKSQTLVADASSSSSSSSTFSIAASSSGSGPSGGAKTPSSTTMSSIPSTMQSTSSSASVQSSGSGTPMPSPTPLSAGSKPSATSSTSSVASSNTQSVQSNPPLSSSASRPLEKSSRSSARTSSANGSSSTKPDGGSGRSDSDATAPTTPTPDAGGGKGAGSGGLVQGTDDDGGLKPSEKAGIAVGVIIFVALAVCCVGIVLFGLWKRRQSEDQPETESGSDDANGPDVFGGGVVVGHHPVANNNPEPTAEDPKDAHPEREATAVQIDKPSPADAKPKPKPKQKPKPKAKAHQVMAKTRKQ